MTIKQYEEKLEEKMISKGFGEQDSHDSRTRDESSMQTLRSRINR